MKTAMLLIWATCIQTGFAAIPPISTRVVERDASHEVIESIRTSPDGSVLKTNRYTRLGNGMNYKDDDGNWVASKPSVQNFPGGIVCTGASYQVIFATNLNTAGSVDLLTSDKKEIVSNPLGIAFFDPDSGRSVVLAQIKNSPAELVDSNHVVYEDAFDGSGIQASVVYEYGVGRFSQNIKFVKQPAVTPADFGMSIRTRLEILTEIQKSPPPVTKDSTMARETNATLRAAMAEPDFVDQMIDFGAMRMSRGHAFSQEENTTNRPPTRGIGVAKHWSKIQGRTILVEAIPWNKASAELAKLPKPLASTRPLNKVTAQLELPAPRSGLKADSAFKSRLASVASPRSTLLASAAINREDRQAGFIIDYDVIESGGPVTTFESGETYLIDGQVTLYGEVQFNAGAIIKYPSFAGINIEGHGSGLFFGGSIIFTSMNDDSAGDIIDGSSGSPNYSAAYAINWESFGDEDWQLGPSDFRYCYGAVDVEDTSGYTLTLINPTFENTSWCVINDGNVNPVSAGGTMTVCNVNLIASGNVSIDNLSDCNPTQDTDGDGLPDAWEVQYFHSINHSGTEDYDGDGLSNLQEYQQGTSPTSFSSGGNGLSDSEEAEVQLRSVGANYARIVSPDVIELSRITSDTDTTWDNFAQTVPGPTQFQVSVDGTSATVQGVGFKKHPIYSEFHGSDTRVEKTLYLKLSSAITGTPNSTSVEVTDSPQGSLWQNMRFVAPFSSMRYSPAIHINQDGYLRNQSKKAKIGYYLGSGGTGWVSELNPSLPLSFYLLDLSGTVVFTGSLAARSDQLSDCGTTWREWGQYQHVLEADFSSFPTAGSYRLQVPGLGVSLPFEINDNAALKLARTYALGIYEQRCGTGGTGHEVNEMPFTRFVHNDCHVAQVYIPNMDSTPKYPDDATVNFHNGRMLFYTTGGNANPLQTAAALQNYDASLYAFSTASKGTTKSLSQGHHDAGDYSKYISNSAFLIHFLVFAADNFPGAAALDNLGIPESGNSKSDLLDEAKWEADFLANAQDSDGGFYFLVYPTNAETESAQPDYGARQVVWPKTTAVTAAAVAALAEIGSSPTFRTQFGSSVGDAYITKAQSGWTFLMNAISAHGKQGAYQKLTAYADDFTHDDELAWAAASLFAATGSSTYSSQLMTWFDPTSTTQSSLDGWWRLYACWGCAAQDYLFAETSRSRTLDSTFRTKCIDALVDAGDDWRTWSQYDSYGTSLPNETKVFANPGWYFGTDHAFDIAVADLANSKLSSTDTRYPTQAQRHTDYVNDMLENVNFQHGENPVNVDFVTGLGYKRQRQIVNQYANFPAYDKRLLPPSGVPIGNLVYTLDTSGDTHYDSLFFPSFNADHIWINEIHYHNTGTDTGEFVEICGAAGTHQDELSLILYDGTGHSYSTVSFPSGTISDQKNGFGMVKVATPGIQNGKAGIALVSCGSVIQFLSYGGSFTAVDGLADGKTSTDIGVTESDSTPIGDSLQLIHSGASYSAFTWSGPIPATAGAENTGQTITGDYALYDRWADVHDVRREFVTWQTARALGVAAYLHSFSGATYQSWQQANNGTISVVSGGTLNSATVVRLNCSDPSIDLSQAQIVWDAEFETQPGYGPTFTLQPRSTMGATLVEAEAVMPDGRRVFGRTYLNFHNPASGVGNFPDGASDPAHATVALYHFDESETASPPPANDSSGHSYTLTPSGNVARGANVAWMSGTPSGQSSKFGGLGDRVETSSILDSVLRPGGSINFTIEAWIYVKRYIPDGTQRSIFTLMQPDPFYHNWSLVSDGNGSAPHFDGPGGQTLVTSSTWGTYVTANTWHLLKVTVATVGGVNKANVYVDTHTLADNVTVSSFFPSGDNWTLSMGDFVGDLDEVRISSTVR